MATPTYDLLATVTITTTTSGTTISNIDTIGAGYRDLVLVLSSTDNCVVYIRLNSDSTVGAYSSVNAEGTGSATSSNTGPNSTRFTPTSSVYGGGTNIIQFFDFSQTDKHKSMLSRASSSANGVNMATGRWANTAAVTSITDLSTRNAGDTFHLYGIAG